MMNLTDKKYRTWFGEFQWPGKKKFIAGCVEVYMEVNASQAEILKAVEAEFVKFWGDILPDNFPMPNTINLIPGSIFFVSEESME